MTAEGELLWEPSADTIERARITRFATWLAEHAGVATETYEQLRQWSVDDLDAFWSAFAHWYGVRWQQPPSATLADARMPGAQWFPDARLNYAEHALFPPVTEAGEIVGSDVAVVFAREDGMSRTLTWGELRRQVASVRAPARRTRRRGW